MEGSWNAVEEIVRQAEVADGIVGVAGIWPDGRRFGYRGDRRFRAASTVKVPIMVEVYRQVDAGEIQLAELHTLTQEEKTPGSGVLTQLHDGISVTVEDLVYLMIAISDNTATNVLIDLAGIGRVNATMRDLGMRSSELGRPMLGRMAAAGDPENWATPEDYATVTEAIVEGRAAAVESCRRMRAMLEKQQSTDRIARWIRHGEGLTWGGKSGTLSGTPAVTNDVGYIESERGRLVLAVFCEGFADVYEAERAIGDISRAVIDAAGIV